MALGAYEHPLDEIIGGRGAEQVVELLGELFARQRRQLDPAAARVALELGQQWSQRVPAMHLVWAVGGHDEHPLATQAAPKEYDECARGPVRPVQILDREQHGGVLAEAIQQPEQRLEQPPLRRFVAGPGRGAVREAWQQRRELGAHRRRQLVEHGVAGARK